MNNAPKSPIKSDKSVFIGGMSKALMQATSHEEENLNQPIKGTSINGDPVNVFVIDTEGLGAFDETQNHDVRIFTLAILLSSSFIYNSMGSIDETSLN